MQVLSQETTSDEFILKTSSIIDDIENKQIIKPVDERKRTGKLKQLDTEKFNFGIYLRKQCGFKTEDPIMWALETRCRWLHKLNPTTGKMIIVKIIVYFNTTSSVTIYINFENGTFMVHGPVFQIWIEQEFPKVNQLMGRVINSNPLLPSAKEEPIVEKEDDTNIIWEKIETISNAVFVTGETVEALNDRITETEKQYKAKAETEEYKRHLEVNYDNKLTLFMETILNDCREKNTLLHKNINSKLAEMRKFISDFKIEVQSQINNLKETPAINITNLEREIHQLKLDIGEINFQELTNSYEFTHSKIKEAAQAINEKVIGIEGNINKFTEFTNNSVTSQNTIVKDLESKLELYNLELNKIPKSSYAQVTSNSMAINTRSDLPSYENLPENRKGYIHNKSNIEKDKNNLEILMCIDSNRKFLNFRILWTLDGSKRIPCSTISNLKNIVRDLKIKTLKYIYISCGCNDLDTKEPTQVADDLKAIIADLKIKFTGIKIIISEITPRKDIDETVIECILMIANLRNDVDVFLVEHNNLRDETFTMMHDNKHIHRRAIPLFASNIKKALRKPYGLKYEQYKNRQFRR